MKLITAFQGEYRFLSNFWPCQVQYEGRLYASVEHAYQAAKVEHPDEKAAIAACATPDDAKAFFSTHGVTPAAGWTAEKKLRIMETLLWIKFGGQEPLLTRALLHTGDAVLTEGNTWKDTFWGVCDGEGENHLGKLLMKIRTGLGQQKEAILQALGRETSNHAVAEALAISERELYNRMIAFSIVNSEYWIS